MDAIIRKWEWNLQSMINRVTKPVNSLAQDVLILRTSNETNYIKTDLKPKYILPDNPACCLMLRISFGYTVSLYHYAFEVKFIPVQSSCTRPKCCLKPIYALKIMAHRSCAASLCRGKFLPWRLIGLIEFINTRHT